MTIGIWKYKWSSCLYHILDLQNEKKNFNYYTSNLILSFFHAGKTGGHGGAVLTRYAEDNALAAYRGIKRGQKQEVKMNSGRQRLNLHGALNAETYKVTVIGSDTVDTESTIRLLEILDNAKYHNSKATQENLVDHPRIKMIFLPNYSPNSNLIERLWKFFKKNVLYNNHHKDVNIFRKACINFFRNIIQYTDEISALMSGGSKINYT